MTDVDTDVDNYTISELLVILDLATLDQEQIMAKTNDLIQKFQDEGNDKMEQFFIDVQERLLNYSIELDTSNTPVSLPSAAEQTDNWWKNEALKQVDAPVQNDKITERKQKIDVYNDHHLPMNRDQLGVNNTYSLPTAQDVLNPNLQNTTNRFVNIDSQFRQATGSVEYSSTDFTLELSETLNNTLSLQLYAIQIPYAWYTIDTAYGNTCFWLVFNNDSTINVKITVEPGNYSPVQFVQQLNTGNDGSSNFNDSTKFTFPQTVGANYPVSYNQNNGKLAMFLYGATCTIHGNTYPVDETTKIVFYDVNATLNCDSAQCNPTNVINQTLGWVMGYRLPLIFVNPSGNYAPVLLDLYGTKYLILVIDDYNQNHLNSGLITITESSRGLKMPSYYNPSIPYVCTGTESVTMVDDEITLLSGISSNTSAFSQGLLVADKLNVTYKQIPQVIPSAPRLLTQVQMYTINEIIKNNERNTNFRSKAPTNSDTFAIIPVKRSNNNTGEMYVEFSGSMKENIRVYFGPVNIERMRVKILDDKGNILNLNGADWSFTLISENLYQY